MKKSMMLGLLLGCSMNMAQSALAASPWEVSNWASGGNDSLPVVIAASNTTPGVQTVTFSVSNSITVHATLSITDPIIIEGGGNTVGSTGPTVFSITGSANGSVIKGLCIVGASNSGGAGINILASNVRIQGNCLGVFWNGQVPNNRNVNNLLVGSGGNNLIGGDRSAGEGNIISYASSYAINVNSSGNSICGNVIGLTPDESANRGNASHAIYINGGSGNHIGLPVAGKGNVIGGNVGVGIFTRYTSNGTVIQNNYIGLDSTSNYHQNGGGGVRVDGTSELIGGVNAWERNVIAGHTSGDIELAADCSGATVVGNFLGTNISGTSAIIMSGQVYKMSVAGNHNLVGFPATGQGNLMVGATYGVYLSGAGAVSNGIYGNTICGFSNAGITLLSSANNNKPAPTISYATMSSTIGTAEAGDLVELFRAERGTGFQGGSLSYLAAVTADTNGDWEWPTAGLALGDAICAVASNASNCSSPFSGNVLVSSPPTPSMTSTSTSTNTPTPTQSRTSTSTSTGTPANTYTVTQTSSATATGTGTSTATPTSVYTRTNSPTVTETPTITMSYTITETRTSSPTNTYTLTVTVTPSATMSYTITETLTSSPTNTNTPTSTVTPSITMSYTITETSTSSPTITVSPSLTATPTITQTFTITPTVTVTSTSALGLVDLHGKAVMVFPNPAFKKANFLMHLEQPQAVKIIIYNFNGERTAVLQAALPVGRGQIMVWDCSQAAPGIYFVRVLMQDKQVQTLKIAVVE